MPKTENNMTKTEVLQLRVTPTTKMKLNYKRGAKSQSDSLNEALSLYLADDNNLLQQIHEGVNFKIQSQDDYMQVRQLYLNSRSLMYAFNKFEDSHREFKTNVWKNLFRDFLLPSLERPLAQYEATHHVNDPITA